MLASSEQLSDCYLEKGSRRPCLSDCPPSIRAGFVKKVYALMCTQLTITGAIVGVVTCESSVRNAVQSHTELLFVCLILGICTMCPLVGYKDRHPLNLCFLALFTFFEAYVVAYVCAAYASVGMGALVAGAFATTTILFAGLSLYVHASDRDFSCLGGVLGASSGALLLLLVVGLFFPTMLMQAAVAGFGILLFSGFVIYDTSTMLRYMTADDAVVAAVQLYLDFINLFLYVLQYMYIANDAT